MPYVPKKEFEVVKTLEYEWVGNIQRGNKTYKVYKSEMKLNLEGKKDIPTLVLRLTTENGKNGYIFHQKECPHRTFKCSIPSELFEILIYEFL